MDRDLVALVGMVDPKATAAVDLAVAGALAHPALAGALNRLARTEEQAELAHAGAHPTQAGATTTAVQTAQDWVTCYSTRRTPVRIGQDPKSLTHRPELTAPEMECGPF